MVTKVVKQLSAREGITDAQLRELNALHRLPKISDADARKLLGQLADRIPTPVALRTFASPCPPGTHAASKKELQAAKQAAKKAGPAATSTTSSTTTTTTTLVPEGSEPEPAPTTATPFPDLPSGTVSGGCAVD